MRHPLAKMITEYPSLLKAALIERDTLRYQSSLAENVASPYTSEDKLQLIVLQAKLERIKADLEAAKARATQELLEKNPKVTAAAMNVAAQADRDVVALRKILIDHEEELALFMAQATLPAQPSDLEEKLIAAKAEVQAVEAVFEMLKLLVSMGEAEIEL
jgi:hypothetical protein